MLIRLSWFNLNDQLPSIVEAVVQAQTELELWMSSASILILLFLRVGVETELELELGLSLAKTCFNSWKSWDNNPKYIEFILSNI